MARLAVDAGFDVVLSNSRGPETLAGLAADLGPQARAASRGGSAAAGDLVLVSSRCAATRRCRPPRWPGRPCSIPATTTRSATGRSRRSTTRSLTESEYLARHVPGARVVKVFNNIFFKHLQNLARPADAADRTYLPVAADHHGAKISVVAFLDSIGYGAVDDESLAESWRQQPGTPVYGTPYGEFENEKGTPAGADVIRAALAAATRM